jgi:hypothetical protein
MLAMVKLLKHSNALRRNLSFKQFNPWIMTRQNPVLGFSHAKNAKRMLSPKAGWH